jgi:hypothetical protein
MVRSHQIAMKGLSVKPNPLEQVTSNEIIIIFLGGPIMSSKIIVSFLRFSNELTK